jgi:NADPH-dependent ferric siderophore reductase
LRNLSGEDETTEDVGLRADDGQWLIEDEAAIGATVRALETFALGAIGQLWERHDDESVRALGNVMSRIGDARTRHMLGNLKQETTPEAAAAMRFIIQVAGWMVGERDRPVAALDQLHAAAFAFDRDAASAGISGPGWLRELLRGD